MALRRHEHRASTVHEQTAEIDQHAQPRRIALNRDLLADVHAARFRQDLYYGAHGGSVRAENRPGGGLGSFIPSIASRARVIAGRAALGLGSPSQNGDEI